MKQNARRAGGRQSVFSQRVLLLAALFLLRGSAFLEQDFVLRRGNHDAVRLFVFLDGQGGRRQAPAFGGDEK